MAKQDDGLSMKQLVDATKLALTQAISGVDGVALAASTGKGKIYEAYVLSQICAEAAKRRWQISLHSFTKPSPPSELTFQQAPGFLSFEHPCLKCILVPSDESTPAVVRYVFTDVQFWSRQGIQKGWGTGGAQADSWISRDSFIAKLGFDAASGVQLALDYSREIDLCVLGPELDADVATLGQVRPHPWQIFEAMECKATRIESHIRHSMESLRYRMSAETISGRNVQWNPAQELWLISTDERVAKPSPMLKHVAVQTMHIPLPIPDPVPAKKTKKKVAAGA